MCLCSEVKTVNFNIFSQFLSSSLALGVWTRRARSAFLRWRNRRDKIWHEREARLLLQQEQSLTSIDLISVDQAVSVGYALDLLGFILNWISESSWSLQSVQIHQSLTMKLPPPCCPFMLKGQHRPFQWINTYFCLISVFPEAEGTSDWTVQSEVPEPICREKKHVSSKLFVQFLQ